MKKRTRPFTLFVFISVFTFAPTFAQTPEKDQNIIGIIGSYQQALNNNHVEGVLELLTSDAVLLLQGAPANIGTKAAEIFYTSLFKNLDFDLQFKIEEIIQLSPEWAFVRTTSQGMVKVIANNADIPGEGHELFILKKQADGSWKIYRYAGSSSK